MSAAATDRLGVSIEVGDTVLYAHTAKSKGVLWKRRVVTKVAGARFYYHELGSEVWGKCANALVVLPAHKKMAKGSIDDLLKIA